MTPRRYLVASAAALLIQSSLLMAMAKEAKPIVQSGQVTTAVSLSLAKITHAAPPQPQRESKPERKPEPKSKPKREQKQTPKPKAKPIAKPEPKTEPEPKPDPVSEPNTEKKKQQKAQPQENAPPPVAARQGAQLNPELVNKATFLSPPTPPRYPKLARRRGHQGVTLIEVWLDEFGKQTKLNLFKSSGHASLDRAALAAVRTWKFAPKTQGGKGEPCRVQVPVNFTLN